MNIIRFGASCFDTSDSEEMIEMSFASKIEFKNLSEFAKVCIKKQLEWEKQNNYTCQGLEERLKLFSFRDAEHEEIKRVIAHIKSMRGVEVQLEPIDRMTAVFEPEWNDLAYVFETEYSYYFVSWSTSA